MSLYPPIYDQAAREFEEELDDYDNPPELPIIGTTTGSARKATGESTVVNLEFVGLFILVCALGSVVIALLEWNDQIPVQWVVKTRLWLHRRKG